jgi:ABC-2 type transport system ATP-binding protein
MIQTFHLTKNYGRFQAVADVNLKVNDGEVFGFLGLNGAGKTTLMRMLTGLLRPTNGYACVDEVKVSGPQDIFRLTGMLSFVSQEMHFYEQANLRELLHLYATLAETTPEEGLAFARKVGVPLDRPCGKFSPGQQRKAQLAIALLKHPRYLLLDEPTAGLDPQGVAEVRQIIQELQGTGSTVFLSSHILSEVQTLCSSVGILHQGILCYQGRIEETYSIQIFGNSKQAAALLQDIGILAVAETDGLRVRIGRADLPTVVDCLAGRVRIGLIQSVSLEDLFQRVIAKGSVSHEA